jgi:hypothetical protein
MLRHVVMLVAAAALWLRPAPVHACSCARPGVEVTPTVAQVAPLNAQVRVAWSDDVKLDEATLVLQPAPKAKAPPPKKQKGKTQKGKGKGQGATSADGAAATPADAVGPVDVDRVSLMAGRLHIVLLRPRAPLRPETRYQVLAAAPGGGKPGVVGEFITGKDTDATGPTWTGVAKSAYVHAPAVCCNCTTGNPWAVVELAAPDRIADDQTPAEAVAYGVWKGEGAFDPAAPPLTVVRPWSGKLYIGHKSQCSPANFDFAGKGTMTLRVAPIDLAGNVGTPVDVTIDLDKPLKKAP